MNQFMIRASRKEMSFGWRYLAFQTVFLGQFLGLAVRLLSLPWGNAEINLVYFCLNFAVTLICFLRFLWESVRICRSRMLRILAIAAVGLVAYFVLTAFVSSFIITVEPGFSNVNDQNISAISQKYYIPTAVCSIFLVPIAEELLHRGAVFGSLYARSRLAAYLVSIVLFALVYISIYIGYFEPKLLLLCFLQYVPAGICLAASYELSGSIVTSILIHSAVNAIGMLAMR